MKILQKQLENKRQSLVYTILTRKIINLFHQIFIFGAAKIRHFSIHASFFIKKIETDGHPSLH